MCKGSVYWCAFAGIKEREGSTFYLLYAVAFSVLQYIGRGKGKQKEKQVFLVFLCGVYKCKESP